MTSEHTPEGLDDIFFKATTAEDGLEKIRTRLLDLTARNKLLNFRHAKNNTLRIVDSIPDNLFSLLINNKSFTFKPVPEPVSDKEGKKPSAKQYAEKLNISTDFELSPHIRENQTHSTSQIQTLHYPLELEGILRKIESSSRTAIEESGTNLLYFAFGFLEWFETDNSSQSYLAPLLLVPVSISRNKKPNPQTGAFEYEVEYSGEDISINFCLSEKLRRDFGLELPDMGEKDTPEKYIKRFGKIITSKTHWKIRRFVSLGFFYFGKLLMYLDLDPHKSTILEHPVVRDFFEGTKIDGLEFGEIYPIDDPKIEASIPQLIFDADSSQHSALIDALSGRNLVIEGPPGTGKSQTITNLIAACLVQGKTVLFVSEKLAALEVVRRRLDEAGLGKFCLELHSHKTKKRELLEDIERRLSFKGQFQDPLELDQKLSLLKSKKSELLKYVSLINNNFGNFGKTIFDILWAETRYHSDLINNDAWLTELDEIKLDSAESLSLTDLEENKSALNLYSKQFQTVSGKIDSIKNHPWYGITNQDLSFSQERELIEKGKKLKELSSRLNELISQFNEHINAIKITEFTYESLANAIRGFILKREYSNLFKTKKKLAKKYYIDENLIPEELRDNSSFMVKPFFKRIWNHKYWKAKRKFYEIYKGDDKIDPYEMAKAFNEIAQNIEDLTAFKNDNNQLIDKLPTDKELKYFQNEFEKNHSILEDFVITQSEFINLCGLNLNQWLKNYISDPLNIKLDDNALNQDHKSKGNVISDLLNINFNDIINRIDYSMKEPESLSEWFNFLRSRKKVEDKGLVALCELAEAKSIKIKNVSPAYHFILFNSLGRNIHTKYPSLMRDFNGLTLEGLRNSFREYDIETIELYRERAANIIDKNSIPPGISTGLVKHLTNIPLIKHEIQKKRRNIPIRQLMNRAGDALKSLKPCFMMGPLSLAQYLVPGGLKFDLLIMDEASQLKPEDALGAVARASQIVIVGDPKQLPPTTFFERLFEEDENIDNDNYLAIQEAESILDIASSLYQPIRRLNWHYRSRHDSLIAFSNKEFYDNKLIIFPSPITDSKNLGVKYHYIENAIYENRSNLIEANYIVDAIIAHMEKNPRESLGVVALNSTQKDLIEKLFEDKTKIDPFAQNYMDARQKGAEPFFIKNLENVQGDERDVIFISITYGRDARGNFYQRFGPINQTNGHRRLNVLFTRSKKRTEVFTSIDPDDIRLGQDAFLGLRALKGYLSFAKKGIIHTPAESERPVNDFEISVGDALISQDFEVVYQVGVAGFYIDIAVRDPNKTGCYILGIECDGATYHSAKSVRERDRLRQNILENLGWNIHRIWSTDWFSNKKNEVEKVLSIIEKIIDDSKVKAKDSLQKFVKIPTPRAPHFISRKKIKERKATETKQIDDQKNLFLTIEEARKQLVDLREKHLKIEFPNMPPEKSLLRNNMIDMLLKELPTNKEEFLARIPLSLRGNIASGQMEKYHKEIFRILEEVIE